MKTTHELEDRKNSSPPSVKQLFVAFLVFLVIGSPVVASAVDLTGTSRSFLTSREQADGTKLLTGYEYLDFAIQNIGNDSISAHFGGWASFDFKEEKDDNQLQYGYVSYRTKERNAVVNLGRVMVFEGVAAERLDGIYARTDIKGDFGIAAFGGAPVDTEDDLPGNNTIYGARVSHQNAGLYTIGLSYLKAEKNSLDFREEEGLDLWFRPVNRVELMGRSAYNAVTENWMEHSYYLILGPFDKLRFNTEASRINYADYFAGTTSNVFKMTSGGALDPKEKANILGEEVFYAISKNWNVSVDYKSYSYDIAGSASYYGAKATYSLPKSYNAGISIHKMDGDTNRLKYDEYRIYASKKIDKIDLAVDVTEVKFKEPINNVDSAFSATVAAGYELKHNLKLGVDVEYSKNPDFDKDVRAFAKLIYSFDLAGSSQKQKEGK